MTPHLHPRSSITIVVLMTGLVAAAYGFGIYLFAQLVPDMRLALGFDLADVGTVTAAAQLGFLVCALLAAWLTPRVGGGRMVLASATVCAAALVLVPCAQDIRLAGALLVLLAGASATVFVPMVDIISRVVAPRFRGMAMGLVSSGTSYGVFVNSLLVPRYAPQGEWRTVWWLVGGITLALTVATLWAFVRAGLLGKPAADSPLPPATSAATVQPHRPGTPARPDWIKPWVLMVWGMNFLLGFATFPFQNYLSSYLRGELAFSVDSTAQIWAAIGFVGMFAGLAVGWLSDRIGLRTTMLLVYICLVCAAVILVAHPVGGWTLLASVLFATAFYPIFGLIPVYVSQSAATARIALAVFGVANVMQGLGGMLGNYGAGLLAGRSGSFVGIYSAIGVVGLALAAITVLLPTAARKDPLAA